MGSNALNSGTKWYPDWKWGVETCKNDGQAPQYSKSHSMNANMKSSSMIYPDVYSYSQFQWSSLAPCSRSMTVMNVV